eukprot:CAMPEP_0182573100 /NCGR_PEP_ID=MMETSP1324-20130603/18194_1 /TAXON_ID=236786 /ORGANISM="Florenciella sp., Strain RCC1587" /LENGTH=49 /DNA_ID= /DNA_START= /DNA_END= /DNA_ORIENTATION=
MSKIVTDPQSKRMSQRHVLLDAAIRTGTRRYLLRGNLLTAAGEEASYQA